MIRHMKFGALKRKTNGPFPLLHDRHKTKVKQNFHDSG